MKRRVARAVLGRSIGVLQRRPHRPRCRWAETRAPTRARPGVWRAVGARSSLAARRRGRARRAVTRDAVKQHARLVSSRLVSSGYLDLARVVTHRRQREGERIEKPARNGYQQQNETICDSRRFACECARAPGRDRRTALALRVFGSERYMTRRACGGETPRAGTRREERRHRTRCDTGALSRDPTRGVPCRR